MGPSGIKNPLLVWLFEMSATLSVNNMVGMWKAHTLVNNVALLPETNLSGHHPS